MTSTATELATATPAAKKSNWTAVNADSRTAAKSCPTTTTLKWSIKISQEKPLTPARLSEIRARAEAAIAGPWFGWRDDDGRGTEILIASKANGNMTAEAADAAICDVCAVDGSNVDAGLVLDWGNGVNRANAEFIAHSRQDVPDLLDEVGRVTAALNVAEKAVLELRAHLERPLFDQSDADWIEALADYDAAKEALNHE